MAGPRARGLTLAVALLAITGAAPFARAQATAWELAGVHPGAARQSTASGKILRFLLPWQGQLYAGHGDYGANTGPITVTAFDPATGAFTEHHVSDTEAIENYRPIGARLFAPAIDRRARADYAVGPPWADVGTLNTTHAYDMATLDGHDLWLVGSQGYQAAAWRSTDAGQTWRRELAVPAASGLADDFARFYFVGVLAGRLYVQAADYSGPPHPRSRVFDGTAWSDGPDLVGQGGGWRPVAFRDHLVYRGSEYGGGLLAFDGTAVRELVGPWAYAVEVFDGRLYALLALTGQPGCPATRCEAVARTADLVNWELLADAPPAGSRSLALLDDVLYAGDSAAQLHRLVATPRWQPWPVRWNHRPTLDITAPAPGGRYRLDTPVRLAAEASDPDGVDGRPARVQFWSGSTQLAQLTAPPYEVRWTAPATGTHRLAARAIDADGAYEDRFVWVLITEASGPPPPTDTPTATPAASATPTTPAPVARLLLPLAYAPPRRASLMDAALFATRWRPQ